MLAMAKLSRDEERLDSEGSCHFIFVPLVYSTFQDLCKKVWIIWHYLWIQSLYGATESNERRQMLLSMGKGTCIGRIIVEEATRVSGIVHIIRRYAPPTIPPPPPQISPVFTTIPSLFQRQRKCGLADPSFLGQRQVLRSPSG